jgi:hypothetical protein
MLASLESKLQAPVIRPLGRWHEVGGLHPFLASGSDLSETVYIAEVVDGVAIRTQRARQTADRSTWIVDRRRITWRPTHWATVPEAERKLRAMLAANLRKALIRFDDFIFSMATDDGQSQGQGHLANGPGVIVVRSHEKDLLGLISAGHLRHDARCSHELVERVMAAAVEPMPAALRAARRSVTCCFCGHPLTDPESRRLGIGPTCRKYAQGAAAR